MMPVALLGLSEVSKADFNASHTGGCNSFTHQSLLSAETDPFRLDFQFEFSRAYSHQYQAFFRRCGEISFVDSTIAAYMEGKASSTSTRSTTIPTLSTASRGSGWNSGV